MERFWSRVAKRETGCWEWTGAIFKQTGYGAINTGQHGRVTPAHRFSYQFHFGEIPNGRLICHTCDNRLCVNPAHLFLGTYRDNSDDMIAKWRWRHPKKLTDAQVREIRALHQGSQPGPTHEEIARQYGIARRTVGKILDGSGRAQLGIPA